MNDTAPNSLSSMSGAAQPEDVPLPDETRSTVERPTAASHGKEVADLFAKVEPWIKDSPALTERLCIVMWRVAGEFERPEEGDSAARARIFEALEQKWASMSQDPSLQSVVNDPKYPFVTMLLHQAVTEHSPAPDAAPITTARLGDEDSLSAATEAALASEHLEQAAQVAPPARSRLDIEEDFAEPAASKVMRDEEARTVPVQLTGVGALVYLLGNGVVRGVRALMPRPSPMTPAVAAAAAAQLRVFKDKNGARAIAQADDLIERASRLVDEIALDSKTAALRDQARQLANAESIPMSTAMERVMAAPNQVEEDLLKIRSRQDKLLKTTFEALQRTTDAATYVKDGDGMEATAERSKKVRALIESIKKRIPEVDNKTIERMKEMAENLMQMLKRVATRLGILKEAPERQLAMASPVRP